MNKSLDFNMSAFYKKSCGNNKVATAVCSVDDSEMNSISLTLFVGLLTHAFELIISYTHLIHLLRFPQWLTFVIESNIHIYSGGTVQDSNLIPLFIHNCHTQSGHKKQSCHINCLLLFSQAHYRRSSLTLSTPGHLISRTKHSYKLLMNSCIIR